MMQKNICVSTTFGSDNSKVSEILQLCVKNGIECIELGSNHVYEPNPEEIVRKYDCHYLVHNYFPIPKEPFVSNIASVDDGIYQKSLNHLFQAIDFCRRIGAKLYTFHPGFLSDPVDNNTNKKNYDFQFNDLKLKSADYELAFSRMLDALSQAILHSQKRGIKIALETGGSVTKPKHVLMQKPEEYQHLFEYYSSNEICLSLNIGHLRLASNANAFEICDFVNLIEDYVVAIEMSHNDGLNDEHKPLVKDAWYWDVILDDRFADVYKILEIRNAPIEIVLDNMDLVGNYIGRKSQFHI